LESAHKAGVLHLDVKPANVLISPDGEPKLADFGIARVRAAVGVTTQTLTFTVGYAAPERFMGDEPTAVSDTYSLGVMLSTLLVGHLPFLRSRDEESWPDVVHGRQLFEPVPDLDPGLPEDLRVVMKRAIAKKPEDRFGSAAEFGAALQALQQDHGLAVTELPIVAVPDIPPGPDQPPVRRRWSVVASLLVAVTLVASALVVVAKPGTCPPIAKPGDGVLSFGTLLPKTGQFVYQGPAMQAGAQLAINEIGAAGGIRGIVVQLDEANQPDEGDLSEETARKAADGLLAGGTDVIVGPGTSKVALEVIDEVVCAGLILFSSANASPVFSTYPDHGLYFRTASSDVFRGPLFGQLVVADGNSTAVVMARDDAFGNDLRKLTAQAIEDSGGRVLDSFSYDPDASSHEEYVQRIKSNDPDAIVLIGFNESASILREMIDQGLGPKDKKVYGGANMTNTLPRLVHPQDLGVLTGMKGILVDDGGEVFVRRLKEVNPGLQDFTFGAETYDAVVITALAAAVAGTDAPAAIAAQINGVTKGGEK
ncbi:MAG: ABC transporter substrate-binding protein, partial [Pseudonocardiaceae bacterium]